MICLLTIIPFAQARAENGFELSYWYSDSNLIACWDINTLDTYIGFNVTTNATYHLVT